MFGMSNARKWNFHIYATKICRFFVLSCGYRLSRIRLICNYVPFWPSKSTYSRISTSIFLLEHTATICYNRVISCSCVSFNSIDILRINLNNYTSVSHISNLSKENLVASLSLLNRYSLTFSFIIIIRLCTTSTIFTLGLAGHRHSFLKPECCDKAPIHKHIAPCVALLWEIICSPFCMISSILGIIIISSIFCF